MPTMDQKTTLRVARIIAGAITAGPALFLAVVFFLRSSGSETIGGATGELVSMISLAPALAAFVLFPVIPRLTASRVADPLSAFRATVILRLAVAESAALLGCVGFLLEGDQTVIGAGVAVAMIVFMAAQFPTSAGLDAWLTEHANR